MARKFLIFFILGAPLLIVAQRDSVRAVRQIALFVPLYLDSAFDESGSYRFDNSFPKFLNPGIEFFEGAQLAMDSLKKDGVNLELTVYDTRSNQKPLARLLKGDELNKTEGYWLPQPQAGIFPSSMPICQMREMQVITPIWLS